MKELGWKTVLGAVGGWRLTRALTKGSPRVFMFHRFGAEQSAGLLTPGEIRHFVNRVREACDFVSMADLVDEMRSRHSRRRPLAAFTVDDGYADFYKVAAPVLRDLNVPATVFCTAGFVDERCWLWWDALRYLIDRCPDGDLEVSIGDEVVSVTVGAEASREHAWSCLADRLVRNNSARARVLQELEQVVGAPLPKVPVEEFAPMSWQQLREVVSAGFEVGGHTATHAFLPELPYTELVEEVEGGKRLLESKLNVEVPTFAYPNGMEYDVSELVMRVVQEAGFRAAVVAYPRPFSVKRRFEIGRWSVAPDSTTLDYVLNGASDVKLRLSPRTWRRSDG